MVDSREQRPLSFSHLEGVRKVETIGLAFGDYQAMTDSLGTLPITFERKSIGDLWGTMTSGYDRFKREMERAAAHKHKLIILVEGTYSEVLAGFSRSEFSGESMVKKLATLECKYDVPSWFCESRDVMARRIVDTFSAVERNWGKDR